MKISKHFYLGRFTDQLSRMGYTLGIVVQYQYQDAGIGIVLAVVKNPCQDIFKYVPILAAPNQTVRFVHVFEDILAPRTRINLLFAALEPCCLAGSFAYNKPKFKDKKMLPSFLHGNRK